MLKLIQRLTLNQNKKTNTEIYSLLLGRRVVSLADLDLAFHLTYYDRVHNKD